MTLYSGVEDPLGPNEQLYSVGPHCHRRLATFAVPGAARVTFLSTESDGFELAQRLVSGLGSAAVHVVDGWSVSAPPSFQQRAALKRYQRLAAPTVMREDPKRGCAFAFMEVQMVPTGMKASDPIARRAAFISEADPAALLRTLPMDDANEWAIRGPAPSASLVSSLVERNSALAYQVSDDLGRFAVVIVGARQRVAVFDAPAPASRRFVGVDAGRVLRIGPR